MSKHKRLHRIKSTLQGVEYGNAKGMGPMHHWRRPRRADTLEGARWVTEEEAAQAWNKRKGGA